jgi:hypothetical protein
MDMDMYVGAYAGSERKHYHNQCRGLQGKGLLTSQSTNHPKKAISFKNQKKLNIKKIIEWLMKWQSLCTIKPLNIQDGTFSLKNKHVFFLKKNVKKVERC